MSCNNEVLLHNITVNLLTYEPGSSRIPPLKTVPKTVQELIDRYRLQTYYDRTFTLHYSSRKISRDFYVNDQHKFMSCTKERWIP